jgi:hypothetical protein
LSEALFGDSLFAIRVLSALAGVMDAVPEWVELAEPVQIWVP